MSGRHYVYSLAVVTVAFGIFLFTPLNPQQPKTYEGPKWAYQVVQLEAGKCSAEGLSASLNDSGQQGWELVGYAQEPEQRDMLIHLSSTYGQPMAEAFTGTLKPAESGCKLVFKRRVQ